MRKWMLSLAAALLLASAITACGSSDDSGSEEAAAPPTAQAVEEAPPAEDEEEEASGEDEAEEEVAEEEAAEAGAALTDEEIVEQLEALTFTLEDGTTITVNADDLAEPDAEETTPYALVSGSVRSGDIDADGDQDHVALIVNTGDEENPQLTLVAVRNDNGVLTPVGAVPLQGGARDVRVENGQVIVDGYVIGDLGSPEFEQAYWAWLESGLQRPTAVPNATPVPTPTSSPDYGPPTVGITLNPKEAQYEGKKVDVYVNATDNPHIVRLELQINSEVISSWDSPDPNGVPYTHHTFTWRDPSPPGDYFIRVKAVDKDGQEGWSKNEEYTILPREE